MKTGISAIVLTKNEEANIIDCLKSVDFCDEIIVIDDNSSDQTEKLITKNFGNKKVKIYKNALDHNFSNQRNFGLQKATYDWVLFVDADERVTESLRGEIQGSIETSFDGFYIQRIDVVFGKEMKHGEFADTSLIRLGKRELGIWQEAVHETWDIKGKIGKLTHPLMHFPHPTIAEFLKSINDYTDIRAKELFRKKVAVSLLDIVMYTKGKFFYNYVYKRGFLDGIPGIIAAILMSLHSFLVRSKLWLLNNPLPGRIDR